MVLRVVKWVCATVAVLFISLLTVLLIGSQLSLDRDYRHSRETAALPTFSPHTGSGLVRIAANGYEFRARLAGFEPEVGHSNKPAVILLHGFPVTSAMWNSLVGPLTSAGYRVLAFDQRGYSPGARPTAISDYKADKLTADVIAVADAAGLDKFHLIGHDWGAVVGWSTVLRQPQRIRSWTGLSIAHPAAFSEALQHDPDQKARSGYFKFFAIPWLPEALFSFNGLKLLNAAYGNMSDLQVAEYNTVFAEPGALPAALNWYRAITISLAEVSDISPTVETPTLFIWGNNDQAVGRFAVDAQAQYMTGPYQEIEVNAGHWLLEDAGDEVISQTLQHLSRY